MKPFLIIEPKAEQGVVNSWASLSCCLGKDLAITKATMFQSLFQALKYDDSFDFLFASFGNVRKQSQRKMGGGQRGQKSVDIKEIK